MSQGPAAHLYVVNQTFSGSSSQQSPSVIEPKQVYCGKTRPVSLILFSSCFPSLALTSLSLSIWLHHFHLYPSLTHSLPLSFLSSSPPLRLPPSLSPGLDLLVCSVYFSLSVGVRFGTSGISSSLLSFNPAVLPEGIRRKAPGS